MRKTLLLLAAVSMAALAACSKKADPSAGRDAAPVAADAAPPTPSGGSADSSPVARTPMLAMAYQLHLALPSDQVRPLMESHQDACERAGPTQCQVIGAQAHTGQYGLQLIPVQHAGTGWFVRGLRMPGVQPGLAFSPILFTQAEVQASPAFVIQGHAGFLFQALSKPGP